MLSKDWSRVLRSDLEKLTELTSAHGRSSAVELKEGERRDVTILFLDIQGFTAMSEKLDPEDVQLIIDNCFKILTNEVEKHRGHIDKYEGDRIMALFGSKAASEQDCERALRAALGMRERFSEINLILAERNIEIGIRIGVNSGLVVTGRIGKGRVQDFTVMGDAVNLASRLESNAPPGEIMIGEEVKRAAGDVFLYKALGEISVKGKAQPIPVFSVVGLNPERAARWERSPFTKRCQYVSRKKEEAALEGLASKLVKAGKGIGTVALSAPAGLGKSRMIHEFLRRVRDSKEHKAAVFRPATVSYYLEPFGLFSELVRRFMADTELKNQIFSASDANEDVEKQKSVLDYISGACEANERLRGLEPKALQLELHLSIRFLIERAAEGMKESGKLLLVLPLEDLHWMDTASMECLEFLGENLKPQLPVLFIWAYRPEFSPNQALCQAFDVTQLELKPLSGEGCGEILRSVLEGAPLSQKEQQLLVRRSGGNPLFMEELIQTLVDEGVLVRQGQGWTLSQSIETVSLPHSIQRILLARFDKLDPDLKQMLTAASVVGETIPFVIAEAVGERMGLDAATVAQRMIRLEEIGFIFRRREEGVLGKEFAFRHALTRDVVYSTLLNHNKKILHELAGRSFEALYGERSDDHASLLYKHFLNGGQASETIQYGLLAVDQMVRQYAIREGFSAIAELRPLLGQKTTDLETVKAGSRLTEAEVKLHDFLGQRFAQEEKIRDLEEVCRKHPEAKLDARVALCRATYCSALGEFAKTKEYASQGLAHMGEHGKVSKLRMDLLRAIGVACYSMGDYPGAIQHYEGGLSIAQELSDRSSEGGFFNTIGLVHFNMGKPEEALSYYHRAHRIFHDIGDRRGDGNALGNEGLVHWTLGNYSHAFSILQESHRIFQEIGFKKGQAVTLGNLGVIHHKLGRYQEALRCYEQALASRREIKDRAGEGYDLVNIGEVYLHLGEFHKAEENFQNGKKIAEEVGSAYLLTENMNSLAIIYRKRGEQDPSELERAKEILSKVLEISEKHNLVPAKVKALSSLGRTLFLLDQPEEALEASTQAMGIIETNPAAAEGSEEDAHINHYHILTELGRMEEARAVLANLVRLIEERAGRIKEEAFRRSFLEEVRQNRYALSEWRKLVSK